MGIPERLKETREQLGHTQAALAELVGSTKRSVINWEGGVSFPGANVLAQYAAVGADVLYILTGQRSQPLAPEVTFPPRERALLDNYRHTDEAGKKIIEGTAGLAAQQQKKAA